jgi:hypothetical protein
MTHHIIETADGQIIHYWCANPPKPRGGRTWAYHIPVINFYSRNESGQPAQTEPNQ